jgi:hypothetical protein
MKKLLLLFFIMVVLTTTLFSQDFDVNDKRIGDTSVNYVNPEISPIGNYMIWIEIDTNNGLTGKVWQCGINPVTGDLIPPDGKGFNPFNSTGYARPADWGLDSLGLYYVGATFAGQLKFVRPVSPTEATVTNLSSTPDIRRRVFYPSQLPGVNKRFLTFVLNDSTIGFSSSSPLNDTFQLRFMDLDFPENEIVIETQTRKYPGTVPMDVIVPRWMKGSPYMTYGFKDGNGKAQSKEFYAYEPEKPPVLVTNDLSNKIDGYPVLNSYNGNQYFMSGINASDTAYIYKRTNFGEIFVQNEVVVPQAVHLINPAFNQSHEPFIFNNRLYSTFQINNDGGDFFETTFNKAGEIWLTTIDQFPKKMWLLSEFDSTLSVSEPEPYVGDGKVWIFYSAVKIVPEKPSFKRQFQLRRCETPVNNPSDIRELTTNKNQVNIYPNPASDELKFIVNNTEEIESLILSDALGNEVLRIEKPESFQKINLPEHCNGMYILRVNSNRDILKSQIIQILR